MSGRSKINSEWGDEDDGADGDDNPFVKAGYDPADQESVIPAIQDATLLETFNTLSLCEMSDGESGGSFHFRATFSQSLIDNDEAVDDIPELVFFERGLNDDFDIRVITGGSFANPTLSPWLSTSSKDFFNTGIRVDTKEIKRAQSIGVGGFDLNAFGLDVGDRAYGFELRAFDGEGPDLNGFFLSAEDSGNFGGALAPVPLPAGLLLLLGGIATLFCLRSRT